MFHCYVGFPGVIFVFICLLETRAVKWKGHGSGTVLSFWEISICFNSYFFWREILLKTCGRRKCAQRRSPGKKRKTSESAKFSAGFLCSKFGSSGSFRNHPNQVCQIHFAGNFMEFHSQKKAQRRQFCFKYIRPGRNLPKTNKSWVDALLLILL